MSKTLTVVWVSKWDHRDNSLPAGSKAVMLGEHPVHLAGGVAAEKVQECGRLYGVGLILTLDDKGEPVGQRYRTQDLRTSTTDTRDYRGISLWLPRRRAA